MAKVNDWEKMGINQGKKKKSSQKWESNKTPLEANPGALFSGRVKVQAIYYRSDDFLAGRVSGEGGTSFGFVIKNRGDFPDVKEGTEIEIRGSWVSSKFGLQVDVSSVSVISQDEKGGFISGIMRFIPNGKKRSSILLLLESIWNDFGTDSESILLQKDSVTSLSSKGYQQTPEMSYIITAAFRKWDREKRVKIIGDLKSFGIRGSVAEKIFDHFGTDSVDLLKKIPYKISLEYGLKDFEMIDSIGKKAGVPPTDIDRLKFAVVSTMEMIKEDGHCSINIDDLIRIISEKMSVGEDNDLVMDALDACAGDLMIIVEEDDQVYPYDMHEAECIVARNIVVRQMANSSNISVDDDELDKAMRFAADHLGIEYTEEQRDAVSMAWQSPISIVTGGPGTGKTTVCRAMVESLEAMGHDVVLCCPTGRGAKRLSETVNRNAMTIHRLIGYNPNEESWEHDIFNQLRSSAIIVDEASMVDIEIMRVLMDATPGFSRLILVGDYDQLPSVGPGRLLRDLIEIDTIPVTRLSHIFRQKEGSDIIGVSHDIKNGIIPDIHPLAPGDFDEGMCSFYHCDDSQSLANKIPKLVKGISSMYDIDVLEVQVLTPMKKGRLGTDVLNRILQDSLNPRSSQGRCSFDGIEFREGDKVMQIKNDYDRVVFNGDSGMVIGASNDGVIIDFDSGVTISYDRHDVPRFLKHSYAITCHKAQGGEFPAGVLVMHESHRRMLQRNLLYTGISRFKRAVVVCGQEMALKRSIENDSEELRNTGLKGRINDIMTVLKG